jgi:hypothetical protein
MSCSLGRFTERTLAIVASPFDGHNSDIPDSSKYAVVKISEATY